MSDIDDVQEFVTSGASFKEDSEDSLFGLFAREVNAEKKESNSKYGQPTQYAKYGPGFMPTSDTIKTLPAGCYDIHADQKGVFAVPAAKQSGLLLELPEMRSNDVIHIVETFWNSENDYKNGNDFVIGGAAYKAGIMVFGPPGCHAKGTEILMFDGSIKKVEDVELGDLLMGPDSKPRTVLELKRGQEEMVKIKPIKGDEFIINKSHILHLTPSGKDVLTQTPINMKFSDWLLQKQNFKLRYKLTRTGVSFTKKELPIDPYFIGLWLGDGNSHNVAITTMDSEIVDYLSAFANNINMQFKEVGNSIGKGKAKTYAITNGIGHKNPVYTALKELELLNNKHIPSVYKTGSIDQRLQLLAGLLDSDGYLGDKTFEFSNKSKVLAEDVTYLARSLGFAAYIKETEKECVNNGVWGTYYKVSISGYVSQIPCKIKRKKAEVRLQIKDVYRTGFEYELLPKDDFYGFTLNEDHLYLTSDFMIHHNSGKSCTLKIVSNKLIERGGTVFYASGNPISISMFLSDFSKIEENRKCIVILEDIDSLIQNYGEAVYLEMLDSAKTINNVLFIATTNYPDRLDPRIYNRPGRFSHVIKIGLPTKKARTAYLKAILKNHQDVDYIVDNSEGFTIDHLTSLVNAVYREKKTLQTEITRLRALFNVPKIKEETVGISFKSQEEE